MVSCFGNIVYPVYGVNVNIACLQLPKASCQGCVMNLLYNMPSANIIQFLKVILMYHQYLNYVPSVPQLLKVILMYLQ